MQPQTPAGAEPAAPASEGPSTAAVAAADPQRDVLNDGRMAATAGIMALVFFFAFGMYMLARWRIRTSPQPSRAKSGGKSGGDTDFFQPAGADAEITFDDRRSETAPAPKPRRSLFSFGRKSAKEPPPQEEDVFDDVFGAPQAAADEAEVVIERPAREIAADEARVPRPKKPAPFARLFAKKMEEEAPPPEPENGDETVVEFIPAPAEPEPTQTAASLAQSVFGRNGEAERRQRLEEERRAAEERDEAARFAAEEDELRRERERRAEREAEFERRKLAAFEQRRVEAEARERALQAERDHAASTPASAPDIAAIRAEIAREYDARFAEMQQRLDRLQRPQLVPPPEPTLRELDQRIARLADRQGFSEASAFDDRMGGDLARRLSDHQQAIHSALESMSSRIDMIAGAPQDVRGLREEIASLTRALGERVTGPNAPVVQLADIVRNALPPDAFELRAMLANNRKADCVIRLPHPPGPIAIDARFPVEAFAKLHAPGAESDPRIENEFRRTALRHIVDIAERLIIPDVTAESALLFIPSETMYSELHARFPDVVQDSYRARVWIVSPTTLMATLHTMRAVLRDARARESAEFIQVEAGHVLSEVDALRRRVVALEENFNRVRNDFRDVVSTTDQVYRRAESISNTRKGLVDEPRRLPQVPPEEPAERAPPRDILAEPAPPAPPARPAQWDDRTAEEAQRQPFPLR